MDNNIYLFPGVYEGRRVGSTPDWWVNADKVGDGSLSEDRIQKTMCNAVKKAKIKAKYKVMDMILFTSYKWRKENGYLEEA